MINILLEHAMDDPKGTAIACISALAVIATAYTQVKIELTSIQ